MILEILKKELRTQGTYCRGGRNPGRTDGKMGLQKAQYYVTSLSFETAEDNIKRTLKYERETISFYFSDIPIRTNNVLAVTNTIALVS